jgi:hypothetical protein
MLGRLMMEPPFRLLVREVMKFAARDVRTRAKWEVSKRPAYLVGVLQAAEQAKRQGVPVISVIEFGVAGGDGLVALQAEAEAVELATGVRIQVYGFDAGPGGLPAGTGDYRDHPDHWQPGDYPMDVPALKARLMARTRLILGDVKETVRKFDGPPVGFVSFDLDLYSSTRDALKIFDFAPTLWHVALYMDDIEFFFNHKFAGEFLAMDEFNRQNDRIKIDRWYGVKYGRPYPERAWLDKMFVAHDLRVVAAAARERAVLPLRA